MSKESLKKKLEKKHEELKSRSEGGNIIFLKPDKTLRVRLVKTGDDDEFIKEVTQFYLGSELKGVISPVTFNEPCALYDKYLELKEGSDDEKELSKKFQIRKRYLAYCIVYKDLKGKEVDESSPKFVLLTSGMYQSIIELFLDDDEWGDMTDPSEEGYDLKLKRTGSGKTDTEYSVTPCSKTAAPKKFRSVVYNLDAEVKKIVPSYEKTKELLNQFLGGVDTDDEDDEGEKPKSTGKKKLIRKSSGKSDVE